MKFTAYKGLKLPWWFGQADFDRYGKRWCRLRARHIWRGWWLVVFVRRGRPERWRRSVVDWLRQFVDLRYVYPEDGLYRQPGMLVCFSKQDGSRIGDPNETLIKIQKYGIVKFYKNTKRRGSTQASMGYSPRDRKWYGWSHRAIYGFGVGYRVEPGAVVLDEDDNLNGLIATTLKDCFMLAQRFAEAVA